MSETSTNTHWDAQWDASQTDAEPQEWTRWWTWYNRGDAQEHDDFDKFVDRLLGVPDPLDTGCLVSPTTSRRDLEWDHIDSCWRNIAARKKHG